MEIKAYIKRIFKANFKKEIPKTLDDCTKPDKVSSNLFKWADHYTTCRRNTSGFCTPNNHADSIVFI